MVRLNFICVLLSIVVNQSWDLCQLDVKNAFLYGDLAQVLMKQPPEYVAQGEDRVCLLRKAIYSFKQSSHTWFEKFYNIVTKYGFQRCTLITVYSLRNKIVVVYF